MKKYSVKVNGVVYDVEIEEVSGTTAPAPAPAAAPAAAPAPAPKAAPSGETVKAPMPGTILKMNVQAGDRIEKDALVCILEAMKMENEIFSPAAGTVVAVNAPKGATVAAGDAIITLG
ncbi:MAG: acetyl-CoA carboxylase biotin carboxyl carrier protein subunit [Clostridia bacterium]|nr:acetyl-CoA carboxylase biotin carboxyl carrier protein subunit [Clostridia bacterium]